MFYLRKQSDISKASRSGYTLTGWRNSAGSTGTAYTTSSTVCSKALTLYAQWKANQYKIYYNSNGGNGTMNDSTVTYDGFIHTSKTHLQRNGYISFLGGAGQKTANRRITMMKRRSNMIQLPTLHFYAVWGSGQYKISFSKAGQTERS